MIRPATQVDIPAVVAMVGRLHRAANMALPMDEAVTARFVAGLLASPLGWVRVVDDGEGPTGFLAASIGTASVAMLPVAIEHGWWAERGGGGSLLRLYAEWAKSQGCFGARMSSPPGAERVERILEQAGFQRAELAWIKVF